LPSEFNIVADLFVGLTTLDAAAKPIPGTAVTWTVSDDGKVYEFRLRDGLEWSDGRALDSADFLYSFRRMLDPATAYPNAARLYVIRNAARVNAGDAPIESLGVSAPAPDLVRLELEHPAPYLLEVLATYAMPVPAHVLAQGEEGWSRPRSLVSNGPFVLAEWVPNAYVRVDRNPRFYDAANVSLEAVYHHHPDSAATALRRFRAGEFDYVSVVPGEQLEWARENLPSELKLVRGFGTELVVFNTRKPPFDDARIRRALSMAVDRQILVDKVLRGAEEPAYGLVPPQAVNYPEHAAADFASTPMDRRRAEARELIRAAGYGPGRPLEVELKYTSTDVQQRVAVALAAMWKAIGVETRLSGVERKALIADVQAGRFDAARYYWLASTSDPASFLERLRADAGPINQAGYANSDYDRMIDRAETQVDLDERAALLRQAEALALSEHPVAPIYYYGGRRLVAHRVTGFVENPRGVHVSRFLGLK
ncbi:MAG TPA: peptide ABC transporter substrate-binding protein, partial [Steroidobacteraceae bacterium]|nr:peptide ABC transporter substrate-binding protein [Steroidobacteraceae bacterium]